MFIRFLLLYHLNNVDEPIGYSESNSFPIMSIDSLSHTDILTSFKFDLANILASSCLFYTSSMHINIQLELFLCLLIPVLALTFGLHQLLREI